MSHQSPEKLAEKAKELLVDYVTRYDEMKPKEKMAIPAQAMREQDPDVRNKNLEEVAIGYTMEQARVEAMRCLQCKKQQCVADCPVEIDIPGFIKHVADGDIQTAIDVIKRTSLLPAICGRVCPQEAQCQKNCTVGKGLKILTRLLQ